MDICEGFCEGISLDSESAGEIGLVHVCLWECTEAVNEEGAAAILAAVRPCEFFVRRVSDLPWFPPNTILAV